MLKRIAILTIIMICCFLVLAQAQEKKVNLPHSTTELACEECHACKNPTAANPCLKICPRHWKGKEVGRSLTAKQGPEVIILKELEKLYEPVTFMHQAHAYWADLNEGCVTCHHYTPTATSHPPCRECHGPKAIRENIEPNLKGAYHRQCMGCHMNWANDTVCEVCHSLKTEKQKEKSMAVAPVPYRPAKTPEKIVYETSLQEGPFVTFFHENHSDMYGLSCKDCHAKQECIACHYQKEKPTSMGGIFKADKHGNCSICHDVMGQGSCEKCHSKVQKKGFDHGQATGWALNIYHQKLSCTSCHPENKPIGKLNRSCNYCHSKWQPDNFKHAIVGLALDETHAEMECTDCHTDRRFDCSSCHDDKTYPKDKPGNVTQKGK